MLQLDGHGEEDIPLIDSMPQEPTFDGRRRFESRSFYKTLYSASPWYIQNVLISAYGLLLQRQVTGRRVQHHLSQLLQSQWLSSDDLIALQARKLRSLVSHAYRNVPYYRRVFDHLGLEPDDIREPVDLLKLPLLSKQDVRQNLDALIARNIDRRKMNYRPTSGTTGTPLPLFATDENEATERALSLRMRHWSGWRHGERRATFGGYMVVPVNHQELPLWRHDWPERRLFFSSYHMTRDTIPSYLEKLRNFRPKVIEGYPSYLWILALYLERAADTIPVQSIFTTSETLYAHQRCLIEERFCCKIFDWYGLTEKAASAVQCECTDGYHVNAEKTIVEIIGSDGLPTTPGEYGEIVGTNLDEYGMPLIRYQSGDMSAYRPEVCECGRSLPLIEQIQTRVDDMITTLDGRLINPAPLAGLFRRTTIEKARIIQETRDRIIVQMVVLHDYSDADAVPIVAGIHKILGQDVEVSVELVEDIAHTSSGKYPFVVSNVPLEV
jgi:phenylacetate-CoA ligase